MTRGVGALVLLALPFVERAPAAFVPLVLSEISASSEATDSVKIEWTTDQPADTEIDYGKTSTYSNTASLNKPPSARHNLSLGGLSSGVLYHYRVKSRDSQGNLTVSEDLTFMTSPPQPAAASVSLPASSIASPPEISTSAAPSPHPGERPPLILIMNPADGAFVSSVVTVSANATARSGVASVQFLLDGLELGAVLTAAPYTVSWNTALVADGPHTLAAVVRDIAGLSATSAIILAVVDNTPPVISAVSAGAVSPSGAVILWTTNKRADSQAEYGATPACDHATSVNASRVQQRGIALSGLLPGTLYYYRVRSRDAAGLASASGVFSFITAGTPRDGAAARALALAPAADDSGRAPQKVLSPALADGINDAAVFGATAQEVSIVDLDGRQVFHAVSSGAPIVWNGRDSSGTLVPSGVYTARILTRDAKRLYQSFAVVK